MSTNDNAPRFWELLETVPDKPTYDDGERIHAQIATDSLADLKRLDFYGVSLILEGLFGSLPYKRNPGSDRCYKQLTNIAKTVETKPNERLVTTSKRVAQKLAEPGVRKSVLQTDPRLLFLTNVLKRATLSSDEMAYHLADAAVDDNEGYGVDHVARVRILEDGLLGGASYAIDELSKSAKGDLFRLRYPKLREGIETPQFRKAVAVAASLSLDEVQRAAWNGFVLKDGIVSRLPGELDPPTARAGQLQEYSEIGVGCPARGVQDLMRWSPAMLLTACAAVNDTR